MPELSCALDKLCEVSRKNYANPYQMEWPASVPREAWCTSPELVSLYGSPAYERLGEDARKKLGFFEAINFFSLNIHGEKALIEGLSRRLYPHKESVSLSPYIHHFLDEENKHMLWFGTFCHKYARKTYPDKKLTIAREYAPGEEDLLFFLKAMIFEEVVDVYNSRMAKDERLWPLCRTINLLHHQDESRHLAFGRLVVRDLFQRYAPTWSQETLAGVRTHAATYLSATWKEYYNPDVYRDAGVEKPYQAWEEARASEYGRRHRADVSAKCVRFLLETGILDKEPSP